METKKTKSPARNATLKNDSENLSVNDDPYQYDDECWHNVAGGEKREAKKKVKMGVSGKSVLKLQKIILNKAKTQKGR